MSQLKISLIFVLVLFESCSKQSVDIPNLYDLRDPASAKINDIFADVEIIPLKFEKKTYPSVAIQVKVIDGYIFVVDKQNVIHVFSDKGDYLSSSTDKLGNGPNEISVMMGFGWNPFKKCIDVLTPDKILSYDVDFNTLDAIDIPAEIGSYQQLFEQIFALSDSKYVLVPTSSSIEPHRFVVFNPKEDRIESEFSFKDDLISPVSMQNNSFFRSASGEVLFVPPVFSSKVYTLDNCNGHVNGSLSFIYDDKTVTKSDIDRFDGDNMRISKFLTNTDRNYPLIRLVADKKIFTVVKHGNSMRDFFTVVTDLASGHSVRVDLHDGRIYLFPLLADTSGKYAYVVYNKAFIEANPILAMGEAAYLNDILAASDDEDLVLLKYEIK